MLDGVGRDRDEVAVVDSGQHEFLGSSLSVEDRFGMGERAIEEEQEMPARRGVDLLGRAGLSTLVREVDRVDAENLLLLPVVEELEILRFEILDGGAVAVGDPDRNFDENRFGRFPDCVRLLRARRQYGPEKENHQHRDRETRAHGVPPRR